MHARVQLKLYYLALCSALNLSFLGGKKNSPLGLPVHHLPSEVLTPVCTSVMPQK